MLTQYAQIGTNRMEHFNCAKYLFDIGSRGISSPYSTPLKAFLRGGFKGLWNLVYSVRFE